MKRQAQEWTPGKASRSQEPSDILSDVSFSLLKGPNSWDCHWLEKHLLGMLYLVTAAGAAAAKSLQSRPTLCDPIDGSPPGSPRPWDSPGKNTGVGCRFLLQRMKVKSESEVAQLCPTLILWLLPKISIVNRIGLLRWLNGKEFC